MRLNFSEKRWVLIGLMLAFSIGSSLGQNNWLSKIEKRLPAMLEKHKELVSLPNVSDNKEDMLRNTSWVGAAFEKLGFHVRLLESTSLPVFFAEKQLDPNAKTILFYAHLDGQPVDPKNWAQEDPFKPVLKEKQEDGSWKEIDWNRIHGKIDPDWRIFARAAADDKAPITLLLTALQMLQEEGKSPSYNIKVILDLQEETSSHGFLSTLDDYKKHYAADYFIIMDGPVHFTNKPTLTFGCRGITNCSITLYGAKLPQHSGHYGNFSPNPIFKMAHLLSSMKDESGKVIIEKYYNGIQIDSDTRDILEAVPDDKNAIMSQLGIATPDAVAATYQESIQYPSLNVRHIETSWKGPGLKTIIPEWVTAHLDVRLVKETPGAEQLLKIKRHIEKQGFLVLDREPTDEERLQYPNIATFKTGEAIEAFRTDLDAPFSLKLREVLKKEYGEEAVLIRNQGGTIPIAPAVTALNMPAIIVPLVNMDNNQHNPNENIRIGNMIDGLRTCLALLSMKP